MSPLMATEARLGFIAAQIHCFCFWFLALKKQKKKNKRTFTNPTTEHRNKFQRWWRVRLVPLVLQRRTKNDLFASHIWFAYRIFVVCIFHLEPRSELGVCVCVYNWRDTHFLRWLTARHADYKYRLGFTSGELVHAHVHRSVSLLRWSCHRGRSEVTATRKTNTPRRSLGGTREL